MSKIRSALEIALERTESVVGDPEKIRISELEKTGKRLMGTYLFDIDEDIESLQKKYAAVAEKDLPVVRNQMIETLLSNISLPQDDLYVEALGKMKRAFEFLAGEDSDAADIFVQVDRLYQQYLEDREKLLDMVKQQYEPYRKQREEQLSRQYGRQTSLQPEQDPEFMKLLENNYKQLEQNYQQGIDQIRSQLRENMEQ